MPSAPNVAVVVTAAGLLNVTVPPDESSRPLTLLHLNVSPDPGNPSSRATPLSDAIAGSVIVWSAPASAAGGWLTGAAGNSRACGTTCSDWPGYAHDNRAVAASACSKYSTRTLYLRFAASVTVALSCAAAWSLQ